MTGIRQRHQWLMAAYVLGAMVALAVTWMPSFLCRAGGAVLCVGLLYMIRQRKRTFPLGLEGQSLVYYMPFLAGTNLIWMGLPWPGDAMAKAWADCVFLAGSVALLGTVYLHNHLRLAHVWKS